MKHTENMNDNAYIYDFKHIYVFLYVGHNFTTN